MESKAYNPGNNIHLITVTQDMFDHISFVGSGKMEICEEEARKFAVGDLVSFIERTTPCYFTGNRRVCRVTDLYKTDDIWFMTYEKLYSERLAAATAASKKRKKR